MEIRDRLVATVLAAGLLLGMAGWQAYSPLVGLGVAVLAVAGACVIYRIDRPGRAPDEGDRPDGAPDEAQTEISRRRPAAERP